MTKQILLYRMVCEQCGEKETFNPGEMKTPRRAGWASARFKHGRSWQRRDLCPKCAAFKRAADRKGV